jgi:hypothetical protein
MAVNIRGQNVCVSGPTAWRWQKLLPLAHNLGYEVITGEDISMEAAGEDFPRRQQHAWDFVRSHIDGNTPCFGWQLHPYIPDHHVICGYDDVGYYYNAYAEEVRGPRPWQELGTTDVTVLQVFAVRPREAAEPTQVMRDALTAGLQFAHRTPSGGGFTVSEEYATGPAAFDNWAAGLDSGAAQLDHHTYNAQVWHECRAMAAEFFMEARAKLPSSMNTLLRDVSGHYADVRNALSDVLEMNPPREKPDWKTTFRNPEAATAIRLAAAAERKALDCVERIVAAL